VQAVWLALLFAGYGFQRGLCAAGLPYDCHAADASGVYSTLTTLAFIGGALGWLAGVTRPARFAWLASPRRCYLWLAYAATLPAFSGVTTIPAMHASLASLGSWSGAAIGVIAAGAPPPGLAPEGSYTFTMKSKPDAACRRLSAALMC
jgi:hypothetical protein